MPHLLYHRTARATAPRLAAYMGIEASEDMREGTRTDFLIRYGTGRAVRLRPAERTLNSRSGLANYNNRLEQLQLLKAGGVPVPPFVTTATAAREFNAPILARDFPEGRQPTQGRGITVYQRGQRLGRHDLYMQLLRKERQFRVHVVNGAVRVREVMPTREELRQEAVWNLGNDFTYRIPAPPILPRVIPTAVQAVAALSLDFGAVDIMAVGAEIVWVLEVNTAPGLADPTLEWYARHLGWACGMKEADMPKWGQGGATKIGENDEL